MRTPLSAEAAALRCWPFIILGLQEVEWVDFEDKTIFLRVKRAVFLML